MIRLAQEDLAQRLRMAVGEIQLDSIHSPAEPNGMYIIRLEANGETYEYHGSGNTVVLVSDPLPRAPTSPGASPIAATASPLPAEEALVPGIIDFHADRTQGVLIAPTTVQAGEEFQITVTTYGGGCEREGQTAVLLADQAATVMVYDITTATQPSVVCTAILKRLPHTATLRFTQPGDAIIRVWGRQVASDLPPAGVPTVLEHRVTVQ